MNSKTAVIVILGAVVVGFLAGSLYSGGSGQGGEVFNTRPSFGAGFTSGFFRQYQQDASGNVSSSASVTVNGSSSVRSFVQGDDNATLPGIVLTSTTTSFTSTQFCGNSVLDVSFAAVQATATVPTSAQIQSAGCLSETGKFKDIIIYNAATGTLTLLGNTSSTVFTERVASTSAVVAATSTIAGKGMGILRFFRFPSSSQVWIGNLLISTQ